MALTLAVPLPLLPFVAPAGDAGAIRYFSPAVIAASVDRQVSVPQSEIHRLASIVFVPWTGVDSCEMRRFDNTTGRISFEGKAACEFSPSEDDGSQQLRLSDKKIVNGIARMRAIHEAFRK